MVLRSSDCPVHLLPDEILRKLLSHERLSFVDRVAAQQVCLRWRDMLSAPQVRPVKGFCQKPWLTCEFFAFIYPHLIDRTIQGLEVASADRHKAPAVAS